MSKSPSSSSQLPQDQLVQAIYKLVNELTDQVNVLHEENKQLRLATNSLNLTPTNTIKDPKVTPPEHFSGDRKQCCNFILQCKVFFTLQVNTFPTFKHQFGYMGSLLSGPVLVWWSTFDVLNFIDIDDFFKKLEEAYGDPESKHAALLKIHSLVQGKLSASAYATEFHPVTAELDWNEAALVH